MSEIAEVLQKEGYETKDFTLSNEPTPESQPQPEASTLEKIRTAVKGTFEKHGVIFKRGGGRPRKDGSPNKLDIPLNAPPNALPASVAAPAPLPVQEGLDPILVKKVCSALIKSVSGFLNKLVHRKALVVGYTPTEANQLTVDCSITAEECDAFTELSEICLRKYGVGSEYMPEIGLTVVILGVGVRYQMVLSTLERERRGKINPTLPTEKK